MKKTLYYKWYAGTLVLFRIDEFGVAAYWECSADITFNEFQQLTFPDEKGVMVNQTSK